MNSVFFRPLKRQSLLFFILFFTACATNSVFKSYPSQASQWKQAIEAEDTEPVLKKLKRPRASKDSLLYLQESARIAQLNLDYVNSRTWFEEAFFLYDEQESRATLSLSQTTGLASSLLSNDNSIPYGGKAYERIIAHHYQALNYLSGNDINGALVEIRRANEEQVYALEKHHKSLKKAEKLARNRGIDIDLDAYDSKLAEMNSAVRQVKNSFQNANTFYLSAIIYEHVGKLDDAWIDYKKAWEIFPDNNFVTQSLFRIGHQSGHQSELVEMGIYFESIPKKPNLVVFFEDGFVPEKLQVALIIPHPALANGRAFSVAFPYYTKTWAPARPVQITLGDQSLGHTQQILDVYALAAAALKEDLFKNILRQTLRMYAKEEFRKMAEEKGGAAGSLVATLYNIISEQADRRSWLSLPASTQILQGQAKSGTYKIRVNSVDAGLVTINEAKTTILYITRVNSKIMTQTFEL